MLLKAIFHFTVLPGSFQRDESITLCMSQITDVVNALRFYIYVYVCVCRMYMKQDEIL